MSQNKPTYKTLNQVVDEETYRTDTSTLLAFDESNHKFLFRALNSNYFLQDDKEENITVLEDLEAEKIWDTMPNKNITNVSAAFPKRDRISGVPTPARLGELGL
ncbi:MAG: hypothetical protein P8X88_08035 [Gammaproteobacteria bacterium]